MHQEYIAGNAHLQWRRFVDHRTTSTSSLFFRCGAGKIRVEYVIFLSLLSALRQPMKMMSFRCKFSHCVSWKRRAMSCARTAHAPQRAWPLSLQSRIGMRHLCGATTHSITIWNAEPELYVRRIVYISNSRWVLGSARADISFEMWEGDRPPKFQQNNSLTISGVERNFMSLAIRSVYDTIWSICFVSNGNRLPKNQWV